MIFGRKTVRSNVALRGAGVASFNHDGLEIARAKPEQRWLPIWHIIFFVYLALIVRLVVMADIGPAAYQGRIDKMSQGTFLERMAAHAMYMDPVSREIAFELRGALRNMGNTLGGLHGDD